MSKNLIRGRSPARRDVLALSLAAALPATAAAQVAAPAASAAPAEPLNVGFVHVTPVGDAGWTFQHDQGRLAMERALGARVRSTVVAGVAEGPDAERVLRDLARQGHRLIFATSYGYLAPALRVAAEFPGVAFENAGGERGAANLGIYNARFYEGRYLAGIAAGHASRRGVAGYVAGFPLPEVVQGVNAFALGMRSVAPRASVRVAWLNAWFDPAREREAALALLARQADVLTHHSASAAVAQVAEAERVPFVAYPSDMRGSAPRSQLTAVVGDWGGHYTRAARAVLAGTWRAQTTWGGLRDGYVRLAPLGADAGPAAAKAVAAAEAALRSGALQPFAGRLVDNEGRQRQARGEALGDARIASMDWLVEGVVGSVARA